jgi:predicted Zn-dependent peptidase
MSDRICSSRIRPLAPVLIIAAQLFGIAGNAAVLPIPQPGPAPVVQLPARTDLRLPNGLEATLIPYGTVPKTTVIVTVGTGAIADGGRPGVASLAADLMKQGIRGGDAAFLFKRAADLGGSIGIGAGVDSFSVSIDVLAEHGPEAIQLLADVLRHPTLPPSELDRLKADMKRAIAISQSQQQTIAAQAFAHQLYGDGPRGRRVREADVDLITHRDVTEFIGRELSAARTRIYVAGHYDRKAMEDAIQGSFADWASGESARVDRSSPISARQIQLIDRPGAKQSTILMGLPLRAITTSGYSDLSQANAILGGAGLLSRLDQNLREEKGWTYGVQTQLEPLQNGSLWMLHADVNTPDTAPALREIFRELARLSGEPLDPQELRRVQNYRAGHFLMGASSREGLIGQLQFVDHHELGADWLPGYLQRLQAVTPEGVRRAAAEIDPSRMTIVVAGDLSRIKSEIDGIEALKGADSR